MIFFILTESILRIHIAAHMYDICYNQFLIGNKENEDRIGHMFHPTPQIATETKH